MKGLPSHLVRCDMRLQQVARTGSIHARAFHADLSVESRGHAHSGPLDTNDTHPTCACLLAGAQVRLSLRLCRP